MGTWHEPGLGWPIAAPLERCAELLGVDLATLCEAAANVEPNLRADGAEVWSLMQLERRLRPEAYSRRRGAYLDRRRTPQGTARQASVEQDDRHLWEPQWPPPTPKNTIGSQGLSERIGNRQDHPASLACRLRRSQKVGSARCRNLH